MVREAIKQYVKKMGIKQNVLAKNAGMTQQALCAILNGSRGIDVEEYIAICDALNLPYDYFIDNRPKSKLVSS